MTPGTWFDDYAAALRGGLPPVRRCADATELAWWFTLFAIASAVRRKPPQDALEARARRGRLMPGVLR